MSTNMTHFIGQICSSDTALLFDTSKLLGTDEGYAGNIEFAAMLADEYILIFISLSAHIQPTEFYQLLLLSSSSVFQSAAAPGWTLKNTSTAASSGRCASLCKTPCCVPY
jgi:hypothetical protein